MNTNQIFRLVLISLSVLVYFYFLRPQADTQPTTPSTSDASGLHQKQWLADSPFGEASRGETKNIVVENEVVKATLSTKGGTIKRVELKHYKDQYGQPVVLLDEQSSSMGFSFPYKDGVIETKDLYFETTANPAYSLKGEEEVQVAFRLNLAPDRYLEQLFSFSGTSYKVTQAWQAVGMEAHLGNEAPVAFRWDMEMKSMESDTRADASRSTVNYYLTNKVFDNLSESSSKLEALKIAASIKWIAMKQRFFTSSIIAGDFFAGGNISIAPIKDRENRTKAAHATLFVSERSKERGNGSFSFFFGPNDYDTLRNIAPGFQQNLPLGWAIVRLINQLLIIPLFSFLEQYLSNYGLIILLLVVVTKLVLAPFAYKSFVSLAKIRLIKPELDAIKDRYKNDPQRIQNEQMLLYKELGINPLSGCVPILLQMPVLLAMFNFFPNAISLRQAPFLWATDLSTYDSVFRLPCSIPVYGDHVSLFTLLMVTSTILYTRSSSQTGSTEGPMRVLAYAMPISFMFVLNSFPAGLSFYYFVSNIFSYLQQACTRYFVDENIIKEKLFIRRRRGDQGPSASFQAKIASSIQATNKKKKEKEKEKEREKEKE